MIREITLKNFKSFTDIHFNFLGKNKTPHKLVIIILSKYKFFLNFCRIYGHCHIFLLFFVHNNNSHMNTLSYYREKATGKSMK